MEVSGRFPLETIISPPWLWLVCLGRGFMSSEVERGRRRGQRDSERVMLTSVIGRTIYLSSDLFFGEWM